MRPHSALINLATKTQNSMTCHTILYPHQPLPNHSLTFLQFARIIPFEPYKTEKITARTLYGALAFISAVFLN